MSKKVKRILILALVLAAVTGIFVLAVHLLRRGKFPGVIDAWNEAVFSKTVEDFPGYMIDNLDERTDTNFIVYAEDVRRVTTENGSNRLVAADHEKYQYTFAAPDEQLTGLKRGDVFFMEPNEYYAYGLCVRVKKVRVQDGEAVIKGKDVRLKDLIEYADVDMDVPVTAFYLDGSGMTEDIQVQWADAAPAEPDSAAVPTPASFVPDGTAQQGVAVSTLALSAKDAAAPASMENTAPAAEDGAPAKASLTLEESRDLFIVCDFYESVFDDNGNGYIVAQPLDTYPDVVQTLREQYPEAKLMTKEEWTAEHPYGSMTYGTMHGVYDPVQEGLSLGDVIVWLEFFDPHDRCTVAWSGCDCEERQSGVKFYRFGVHVVLDIPDTSAYYPPQIYQYYRIHLDRKETYAADKIGRQEIPYFWVTDYGAGVYERIPTAPIMDDEYQYNAERTADNIMEYKISFPVGPMRTHDYNMQYAKYAGKFTDYGLDLLFSYVDELWYR